MIDFENALRILYPFKEQLELVKKADNEGLFDFQEITDPWSALTYFRESNAYENLQIKRLSTNLFQAMKALKQYHYTSEMYDIIHNDSMKEDLNGFESWRLDEVYYYLQMMFEPSIIDGDNINDVVIENVIINGQLLDIINCFLYRI